MGGLALLLVASHSYSSLAYTEQGHTFFQNTANNGKYIYINLV